MGEIKRGGIEVGPRKSPGLSWSRRGSYDHPDLDRGLERILERDKPGEESRDSRKGAARILRWERVSSSAGRELGAPTAGWPSRSED